MIDHLLLQVKNFLPPWANGTIILLLCSLAFAFFASHLVRILMRRLKARLARSNREWDDILVGALQDPFSIVIWLLVGNSAIRMLLPEFLEHFHKQISIFNDVVFVWVVAWVLIRFLDMAASVIEARAAKWNLDSSDVLVISKVIKIIIIVVSILIGIQQFGYSISGILAFGSVGGIALSFAAKDLLANFFGGFMVYLDRPFAEGEWIRSPDKQIEGTVEHVGWRVTRIRTFDQRPLYVPNAVFSTVAIENPSRMLNRRIAETVGIRYDDIAVMSVIVSQIKQMLIKHRDIDKGKTLIINFSHFGPSSLDIMIYTFTKTTDWVRYHEVKQDVLLKIADIIAANNAEIAFPTTTIKYDGIEPDIHAGVDIDSELVSDAGLNAK